MLPSAAKGHIRLRWNQGISSNNCGRARGDKVRTQEAEAFHFPTTKQSCSEASATRAVASHLSFSLSCPRRSTSHLISASTWHQRRSSCVLISSQASIYQPPPVSTGAAGASQPPPFPAPESPPHPPSPPSSPSSAGFGQRLYE